LNRRKALKLTSSTAFVGGLAGCLGGIGGGNVGVRINNRDDTEHTLSVEFADEEETVATEEFTAPAGEETTWEDVVGAGEYTVTGKLDSSESSTINFRMQGCDSNLLYVSIFEDGTLEMGALDEC